MNAGYFFVAVASAAVSSLTLVAVMLYADDIKTVSVPITAGVYDI